MARSVCGHKRHNHNPPKQMLWRLTARKRSARTRRRTDSSLIKLMLDRYRSRATTITITKYRPTAYDDLFPSISSIQVCLLPTISLPHHLLYYHQAKLRPLDPHPPLPDSSLDWPFFFNVLKTSYPPSSDSPPSPQNYLTTPTKPQNSPAS